MKVRKGFVSNSSSSSFILAFDRPIESKEDLEFLVPNKKHRNMLFDRMNFALYNCIFENSNKCNECKERFTCATDTVSYSHIESLLDSLYSDYWRDDEEWIREYSEDATHYLSNRRFANKYLYTLRLASDNSEEANMYYDHSWLHMIDSEYIPE